MLVVGFYGKMKKVNKSLLNYSTPTTKLLKLPSIQETFLKRSYLAKESKKLNSHMIHINSCHHEVLPLCALCGEYIKIHLSCSNLPKSISRMMKLLQANFCDGTCVSP